MFAIQFSVLSLEMSTEMPNNGITRRLIKLIDIFSVRVRVCVWTLLFYKRREQIGTQIEFKTIYAEPRKTKTTTSNAHQIHKTRYSLRNLCNCYQARASEVYRIATDIGHRRYVKCFQ